MGEIINFGKERIIRGVKEDGSKTHGEMIDFEDLDSIRRGKLKTRSQIEAISLEKSKKFSEQIERREQRADFLGQSYPTLEEMINAEEDD